MSSYFDQPVSAHYHDGKVHVSMASGIEIAFPIQGNPRLQSNPPEQLDHIELSPFGLHWPDLAEDLSIRAILGGDYARRPRISPARTSSQGTP